jgi:colanic acid biosynthesis protein WcaH
LPRRFRRRQGTRIGDEPVAKSSPAVQNSGVLKPEEFLRIVDATPLVSIDLILRNERGEVLLGGRINRPAQGFWFVPGGRIWKNEKVQDALRRISQRELGVTITEAKLLGVYDHIYDDNFLGAPQVNTHYVVLGFEAALSADAKLTADDQHGALQWWNVKELLSSDRVHPNTKAYFR